MNNLAGQKFGRLIVLEKTGSDKWKSLLWKCLCDCGNETVVRGSHLVAGATKSCGCLCKETIGKLNYIDGRSKEPDYGKEYRRNNRGIINARTAKRRAKKLRQTPPDADINAIQEIYRWCAELNSKLGKVFFHVDHIVPLDKGGLHHEDNLMIIPWFQNNRKYTKDPKEYYGRHYNFMTGRR